MLAPNSQHHATSGRCHEAQACSHVER